jgi:hypothetical protein
LRHCLVFPKRLSETRWRFLVVPRTHAVQHDCFHRKNTQVRQVKHHACLSVPARWRGQHCDSRNRVTRWRCFMSLMAESRRKQCNIRTTKDNFRLLYAWLGSCAPDCSTLTASCPPDEVNRLVKLASRRRPPQPILLLDRSLLSRISRSLQFGNAAGGMVGKSAVGIGKLLVFSKIWTAGVTDSVSGFLCGNAIGRGLAARALS